MKFLCVRTYFLDKRADSFDFHITNSHLIARGMNGHKTIEILPCITTQQGQEIKYKIIIKNLYLLQIGDLASQMFLQGR